MTINIMSLIGVIMLMGIVAKNAILLIDFAKWMELDLEYIDTWSLSSDMKIIARTLPAMLRGTGM